jgi:hypothetical protein
MEDRFFRLDQERSVPISNIPAAKGTCNAGAYSPNLVAL